MSRGVKIPGSRQPTFIPTTKEETLINQRKRVAKRLASGLMAGALALGGLAISGSSPAGAVPIEEDEDFRISGDNRYETAANLAATIEDEIGVPDTVIVANGENFPDALAASALTDSQYPILLVQADNIPSDTRDQMNRLADDVDDVLIIGGEAAVSADVEADIADIFEDSDVARISGDDRYATAAAVADEVGYADMVFIVSGQSWADAVTVGGYASSHNIPVLLANASGIPDATSAALETALDDGVTRAVIVGGTAVVGSGVEEALVELGFAPAGISRIAGADRYATNLAFNVDQFADSTAKYLDAGEADALSGLSLMLVTGANFPDALAAAPLAAEKGSHLVLVNPSSGGSSWLTLGAVAGTALNVDSVAGAAFSTAALTDNEMLAAIGASGYFGQELWIIGGQTAVPSSVVTLGAGLAASSVDCSVIVNGGNEEVPGGPGDFVIAFSKDLSSSIVDGVSNNGEEQIVDTDADMEAVTDVNGDEPDMSSTTLLDLNNNGNPDAVYVTLAADLEEGDEITFNGWETDVEDYATTGVYLRDFNACSAEVDEDEDAPTVDIYMADGSDKAIFVFSEATKASASAALKADLEASTAAGVWTCANLDSGNTTYTCDSTVAVDATTDDLTLTNADYTDDAGNELDSDTFVTGDVEAAAPAIDSATITCANMGVGLDQATAWDDAYANVGAQSADDFAEVNVAFAGGDLSITSNTALAGLTANDWSFTVTHERGLIVPTLAVDGTDVTITIDRYVHTAADVARLINNTYRGGLPETWEADATGIEEDLIDADILDEANTAENSGTERTQTCHFTITMDNASADTLADTTGTPTAAGDIRITIDGEAQAFEVQYVGASANGGLVIEGVIWNTTSTGTTKVSTYLEDLLGTGALDTVTI